MTSAGAAARKAGAVATVVTAAYLATTAADVWRASRLDQAGPVDAIVVLGAAQRRGRPSPALRARLDHAYELWSRRLAPLIVVTGGRTGPDRYSEAGVSARYLHHLGVPDTALVGEDEGRNTWQSLRGVAALLAGHGGVRVLLVSDPFHVERARRMAGELGMEALLSPTRRSPVKGVARSAHFAKETAEVALGRVVGFGRLVGLAERVLRRAPAVLATRWPAAKVTVARSGVV